MTNKLPEVGKVLYAKWELEQEIKEFNRSMWLNPNKFQLLVEKATNLIDVLNSQDMAEFEAESDRIEKLELKLNK